MRCAWLLKNPTPERSPNPPKPLAVVNSMPKRVHISEWLCPSTRRVASQGQDTLDEGPQTEHAQDKQQGGHQR